MDIKASAKPTVHVTPGSEVIALIPRNELVLPTIQPPAEVPRGKPKSPLRPAPSQPAATPTQALRHFTPAEVRDLIRIHAASYGLEPALPIRIASCESGLSWNAANPRSTAKGIFQYLSAVWNNTSEGRKGTSVFDADANIRMAIGHMATHRTGAWSESADCWR
jgi:hypothetical protein